MADHLEMPREPGNSSGSIFPRCKIETKRVTWPGKQEIYGTTVMVILTTFLFGIYFWVCDRLFGTRFRVC